MTTCWTDRLVDFYTVAEHYAEFPDVWNEAFSGDVLEYLRRAILNTYGDRRLRYGKTEAAREQIARRLRAFASEYGNRAVWLSTRIETLIPETLTNTDGETRTAYAAPDGDIDTAYATGSEKVERRLSAREAVATAKELNEIELPTAAALEAFERMLLLGVLV